MEMPEAASERPFADPIDQRRNRLQRDVDLRFPVHRFNRVLTVPLPKCHLDLHAPIHHQVCVAGVSMVMDKVVPWNREACAEVGIPMTFVMRRRGFRARPVSASRSTAG